MAPVPEGGDWGAEEFGGFSDGEQFGLATGGMVRYGWLRSGQVECLRHLRRRRFGARADSRPQDAAENLQLFSRVGCSDPRRPAEAAHSSADAWGGIAPGKGRP